MRILHVGNVCNVAYTTVKFLRQIGVEADLLLNRSAVGSDSPENEDPGVLKNPPKWIKFYSKNKPAELASLPGLFSSYDILHGYSEAPSFLQIFGKKLVAHATGSDLRELAFEKSGRGRLLRHAYEHADILLFANLDHLNYVQRLKLRKNMFFPLIVDVSSYPVYQESESLVFFHPARHDWQLKGNQKLIRAFASFIKKQDAKLIMVSWGKDINKSISLVQDLGIAKKVRFIEPVNKIQLKTLYQNSTAVFDQFNLGAFGMTVIEAMASHKPVVTNVDIPLAQLNYGVVPPTINAKNETEILSAMQALCSPRYRKTIGLAGRSWVEKFHDAPRLVKKLSEIYSDL